MKANETQENLHRRRQTQFRTEAAIAAAVEAARQFVLDDGPGVSNPISVLRGILWELIEGAYDEGYASGEDQTPTEVGAE